MRLDVPIEVAQRRAVSFRESDIETMDRQQLLDAYNELKPKRPRRSIQNLAIGRELVRNRLARWEAGEFDHEEETDFGPPVDTPHRPGDPGRSTGKIVMRREPKEGSLAEFKACISRKSKRGDMLEIIASPESMTVTQLAAHFGWQRIDVIQVLYLVYSRYGIGSYEDPETGKIRLLVAP